MPIHVTCSECHLAFHVDDEFAGRLGRCPQCETVLEVPAAEPVAAAAPIDDPYHSHQAAKAFDEFPDRRTGYDDYRPEAIAPTTRSGPRALKFDKEARAAKWHSVSNGLRNLMVALILVAVSQGIWLAFLYTDGVQPGQQQQLPRQIALNIGDAVFLSLGLLLWGLGRIGCGRVPYVPARRVARPAAVIAGMTTASGVVGVSGFLFGIVFLQQNMAAGALLLLAGLCSLFPAMAGFVVAEVMGLISQMRMATGLNDPAFARATRVQFVLALLLSAGCMVGVCAFTMFVGAASNKKQQEEIQKKEQEKAAAAQDKDKDAPPKDKAKEAPEKKKDQAPAGKQKGKGNGQAGNGPGGQQQEPPPPFDIDEYPEVKYTLMTSWLLVVATYTIASIFCFQLGRAAIRREIAHLVGDPHDHDHHPHR